MTGAKLEGADLTDTNLTSAKLANTMLDPAPKPKTGAKPKAKAGAKKKAAPGAQAVPGKNRMAVKTTPVRATASG